MGDKPRRGTLGAATQSVHQSSTNVNNKFRYQPPSQPRSSSGQTNVTHHEEAKQQNVRECYICQSKTHLKYQCPQYRAGTEASKSTSNTPTRKVDKCTVENKASVHSASVPAQPQTVVVNESQARRVVDDTLLACKSAVNGIVVAPCVQLGLDDCEISKLHYISVGVASTNHSRYINVIALEDGGAQLAVANRSVIAKLDDVSVIGSVKIGLALGDSVTCDLVRLNVCPVNADGSTNSKHTVTIACAVSDIVNDELLIPADIVKRLNNVTVVDDDIESCCSDDTECGENDISSDECSNIDNECNANEIDELLHVNVVTRSGCDTASVSAAANVAAAIDNRPRPIVSQLSRAPDIIVN